MSGEEHLTHYRLRTKAASVILSAALLMTSFAGLGGALTTAEEVSAATDSTQNYGLMDNIQDGTILHCFDWTYNDIRAELPNIAAAGFTSVQTSPAQTGVDGGDAWYWLYQPVKFSLMGNVLGTPQELQQLCEEAHQYGIKVIVDVVANHLAENHQQSEFGSTSDTTYWHDHYYSTSKNNVDWTKRYQVTHCDIGMPDLNTENEDVQSVVKAYLTELQNLGVDGIRFDAIKHIGLPSEGDNFLKNALPEGLYYYGEILGGPDDSNTTESKQLMKEYTDYISVTDNTYGETILKYLKGDKTIDNVSHGYWAARSGVKIDSNKLIYWGESHDTYANHTNENGWTKNVDQNLVDRAYAMVGSRAGASALYFSRPYQTDKEAIKAGEKGSTHFTSAEVAAVNHFHNAMGDAAEYFVKDSNSQCLAVCRTYGAVIVARSGGNQTVTLQNGGSTIEPGTYTDEITGNAWTVTESTITGTIGSSGIAVVYNSDDMKKGIVSATPATGTQFKGTLDVTLNAKNVEYATYQTSEDDMVYSYNNGQIITIGDKTEAGENVTLTLRGWTYDDQMIEQTYTYTKKDPNEVVTLYFDNSSYGWSNVYAYIYNDTLINHTWPGEEMTKITGTDIYYIEVSDELAENGGVIFSDGNSRQTGNRYPADGNGNLAIGNSSHMFTKNNTWTESEYGNVWASKADGTKFNETLEVTLSAKNVKNPTYTINGVEGSYADGKTITIGGDIGYGESVTLTLTGTKKSGGETVTASYTYTKKNPAEIINAYFDNSGYNWSSIYAYIYDDNIGSYSAWPGEKMTKIDGTNCYTVEIPNGYENGKIIFSQNGSPQYPKANASGLDISNTTNILSGTSSWNKYEPLGVTLSADSTSTIFGNAVSLSADKSNGFGTVTYTFSVNGSTIDSNGASATWTPTQTGTYTVKVTAKDSLSTAESSQTVTVNPADISNANVELSEQLYYNATVKTQNVKVSIGDTVLADTDYTVTNNSAKDIGAYTLTVTGTGNYTGTVSKDWTIEAKKYTITVVNGKLPSGKTTNQITADYYTTVTADAAPTGQKFSHWERDGVIVSYNENYTFPMPTNDVTVKAVYTEEAKTVEKAGTAYIQSVTPNKNTKKISFVSVCSVPTGYSIVSAGLVATNNLAEGEVLTTDNAQFTKLNSVAATKPNLKYTWTKANVTEDQVWYVRSYLVYKDASGKQHTVYGDLVKANLNGQL